MAIVTRAFIRDHPNYAYQLPYLSNQASEAFITKTMWVFCFLKCPVSFFTFFPMIPRIMPGITGKKSKKQKIG
jgi:hypothetical protein